MSVYQINKSRYGTHCLIAQEIGSQRIVLDIGCNKGYLKSLVPDNIFFGLDIDGAHIAEAKKNSYSDVYQLDLNHFENFKILQKFDVIVFADILEHLLFPEKILRYFILNYLKRDGKIIISLPNIANFLCRLNLLLGNFTYTEEGVLDKTHLHFYTLKTAETLITSCGLVAIRRKFSSNNFGKIIKLFPFLGTLLGYNLIFVCKKKY